MSSIQTTITDELGNRSRSRRNFVADAAGTVTEFKGGNIPRVLRIDTKSYTKNGKWSHNKWEVTLAPGAEHLEFIQSWETGQWFNAQTWAAAREEAARMLPARVDAEQFIRDYFEATAKRLDEAEANDPLA